MPSGVAFAQGPTPQRHLASHGDRVVGARDGHRGHGAPPMQKQKSFQPLQIFAMGGGAALGARMAVRRSAKSESTLTLEPTRPSHNSRELTQGSLQGDVFLLQTPLILPSPLPSWIAQALPKHSVVLAGVEGGYAAFDFVPAKPEDPGSALQLLLGGSVEGLCGTRKLRGLPRGAVRLGRVAEGVTVEDVINVNERFDKMLSLTANDCNSYSQSVLAAILADPDKLVQERLFSTLDWDEMQQSSKVQYKEPSVTNAIVLVAGTTVGAGILALPAVTQPAGFVPSTVALTFAWMYMAVTGLFIAEVACRTMAATGKRATSLQSMASTSIGPAGAWLSSAAFVFLHMALLIAYCSRGGELLTSLIPILGSLGVPGPAVFASLFGGFIFLTKGTDALDQGNNAFAVVVAVSFFALVALAIPAGDAARLLAVADWGKATDTVPTLLLSLVYHNVVPTVCAQLEGDRGKITTAIVVGSLVPFLMFVVWNAAVLAALPIGSAGDPLEVLRSTGSPLVATGILAFSLSAIVTSFVGFVVALTDFFADLDNRTEDSSLPLKLRDFALTLVPPVIVACLDPSLFFQAIDKAGAFGVSTLFGLLPAWMVLTKRSSESPVLTRVPQFLGGYVRGPLVPGGPLIPVLAAVVALLVVGDNALELLHGT
ncbi:tyrP [Symbiodinium sp. CCMP2592]|nr:tyrP [Symbiodinium sp. CCMP2592]